MVSWTHCCDSGVRTYGSVFLNCCFLSWFFSIGGKGEMGQKDCNIQSVLKKWGGGEGKITWMSILLGIIFFFCLALITTHNFVNFTSVFLVNGPQLYTFANIIHNFE